MNRSEKNKIIAANAGVLAIGMLASFVLPMIGDSLTDGRGAFLRMILHVIPSIVAMFVSTLYMSKAIGQPND